MLIRKANRADSSIVWEIRNLAITAQCSKHYPFDLIMKWTSGEPPEYFSDVVDDGFWVAEIDHEIVGTGKVNLQTGKVDAVFVHPQRVRFGIGAKIIKHLEHIAIDVGLIELNLESTLNAAPFYRSCGFQGIEIAKYNSPRGIELDCILMSKKLL